jgi:hypothetical protein
LLLAVVAAAYINYEVFCGEFDQHFEKFEINVDASSHVTRVQNTLEIKSWV